MNRNVWLFSVLFLFTSIFSCSVPHTVVKDTATLKSTLSTTFTNPIGNGADPWVIKHRNFYYVCQSSGGISSKGISVSKSDKLTHLGKPVTVWNTPSTGWNSSQYGLRNYIILTRDGIFIMQLVNPGLHIFIKDLKS